MVESDGARGRRGEAGTGRRGDAGTWRRGEKDKITKAKEVPANTRGQSPCLRVPASPYLSAPSDDRGGHRRGSLASGARAQLCSRDGGWRSHRPAAETLARLVYLCLSRFDNRAAANVVVNSQQRG